MNGRTSQPLALVITLGAPHDKPWWWAQLEASPWRKAIEYRRMTPRRGRAGLLILAWELARLLLDASRRDIRYVFTFESDITCYLIGLLQRLPGFGGPRHVILQFISREKDTTLRSRLKDVFARICLRSVYRAITSSRSEADYYRVRFRWPAGKTVFIPFHTDDRLLARPTRPARSIVVAAGRSYRDYATLVSAVAGTGIRTIIVCGRRGPGVTELPAEVEVVSEIPLEALLDLMAEAQIVVLPLEDRRISIGQTVLLQAMALGRPVIASRTAGTEDYIESGSNGLLVTPYRSDELRSAIVGLMNNVEEAGRLGKAAQTAVERGYRPVHYVAAIATHLGCGKD